MDALNPSIATAPPPSQGDGLLALRRPVIFGLLAAAALIGFYLGIITLAQGRAHAFEQLGQDFWFIAAITIGFGTQVGLFTYLRRMHLHAGGPGMAASTGTSTAAMLACCAHHLIDVLPILGLSSAAIFLNTWKTPLLWLGIAMNLLGILSMARKIRQHGEREGGMAMDAGRGESDG